MVATQNLEATIVALEQERLAAMVAADTDTLDRILADDGPVRDVVLHPPAAIFGGRHLNGVVVVVDDAVYQGKGTSLILRKFQALREVSEPLQHG